MSRRNMLTLLTIGCVSLSPITASSGGTPSPGEFVLSAASLHDALRGEEIAHRGRIMSGATAMAFADGYVFATADRLELDGKWCGAALIAPNELINHIFDNLPLASEAEATASDAIGEILADLGSC